MPKKSLMQQKYHLNMYYTNLPLLKLQIPTSYIKTHNLTIDLGQ